MRALTNRELFNTFTLALFKQLNEEFPSPTDVDATKIAVELLPGDIEGEDGLRLLRAAGDSVAWLAKENFITVGSESMERGGEYFDVCLTSRGLAVLNSTPDAISGGATIGSQIVDLLDDTAVEAVKDEAKEQLRVGAARIMGYVIKLAAGWLGAS